MDHVSNYQEDLSAGQCHKLCDETGHPVLSLWESQWKLRQQHNQNFPMEGKEL